MPDEPLLGTLYSIYHRLAPEAKPHLPVSQVDRKDPIDDDSSFTSVQTRTYAWSRSLHTDDWVGMVTTYSDHQRLEPRRLAALQHALKDAIRARGGRVYLTCGTFLRLARRS